MFWMLMLLFLDFRLLFILFSCWSVLYHPIPSFSSLCTKVRGLEFRVALTSVSTVHISSKLSEALPSTFLRQVFTNWTRWSQYSPHQAVCSAMNFQVMPLFEKNFNNCRTLLVFYSPFKSWSALLNFVEIDNASQSNKSLQCYQKCLSWLIPDQL